MKIDIIIDKHHQLEKLELLLKDKYYKPNLEKEELYSKGINSSLFELLRDTLGQFVIEVDQKTRIYRLKNSSEKDNDIIYQFPVNEKEIIENLNMPTYKSKHIVRESNVINDFKLWCESLDTQNEEGKVLHAFDMDETLVYSYGFESQVKDLIMEYLTPEDILNSEVRKIGTSIENLKYENGRIFFDDPNGEVEIPIKSSWVRKKGRIYLTQPDSFLLTSHSHPVGVHPKMVQLYNSVKNKAIITARYDSMRNKITSILQKLNIELPNCGLHMYPSKTKIFKAVWKSDVIIDLIKQHGFTEVHYYDDNIKLLKKMKTYLADKNLNIHLYKVSNDTYRKL